MTSQNLRWTFLRFSKEEAFAIAWCLLPAAGAFAVFQGSPYFPRDSDDAQHWLHVINLSEGGFGWSLLGRLYLFRGMRPILLPVLASPLFLITHSVALATQLLMTTTLAMFSLTALRIFRRFLPLAAAVAGTMALSTLPLVAEGSLYLMAELPFLLFSALALDFFLPNRASRASAPLVGLWAGLAISCRPAEGAFFFVALFAAGWLQDQGSRKKLLKSAGVCVAFSIFWFFPSRYSLWLWIAQSLSGTGLPSGPKIILPSFETISRPIQVCSAAFTPVGISVVGLVSVVAFWKPGRLAPPTFWVLAMAALPFLLSALVANRMSAVEPRYFLVPTVFCLGYFLLQASGWQKYGWVCSAVLLLGNLQKLPGIIATYRTEQANLRPRREDCFSATAAGLPLLKGDASQIMVISDSDFFIHPTICAIEFRLRGLRHPVLPNFNPELIGDRSSFLSFSMLVYVTEKDAASVLTVQDLSPEKRANLQRGLEKFFMPPSRVKFRSEGQTYHAWQFLRKAERAP